MQGVPVPPAPWCVQIDAVEQGPEGCGIKGDPCGPVRDRRTLEGTTQKPLLPDHPSGAVEVEALGELAAAGEKEVEVSVGGLQAEGADAPGEGIEAAAHIHRVDGEKDADGGRECQHDRRTARIRRRVCS